MSLKDLQRRAEERFKYADEKVKELAGKKDKEGPYNHFFGERCALERVLHWLRTEEKSVRKDIKYLEKRIKPYRGISYIVDSLTQNDSELRVWRRVLGK